MRGIRRFRAREPDSPPGQATWAIRILAGGGDTELAAAASLCPVTLLGFSHGL